MSEVKVNIKGYRQLSDVEQSAINKLKTEAEQCRISLDEIQDPDGRWLAIAKTHLQQGYMAAIRAIAKPETF